MEEKRLIDKIRESSGHTDIGSKEDGAIMKMKNIGGRRLIIKERSIYEMIMADDIDPNRTNINLPSTIQKLIIDKGTDSEIVSRILLTAMTLFSPEYIIETVNCTKIISLSIDLLSEVSILEKEISEYIFIESSACKEYEERKIKNLSFKVPSIISLESKCKTIFQKADHVEQILMDIVVNFYTNLGLEKKSHFPKLQEKLKVKYGETDPFVQFLSKNLYFMQVIRELRNGFDHRLEHTKVFDFELQPNGKIIAPTIELTHKNNKLKRTSLSDFLDKVLKNIVYIIELTFVFLAEKNTVKNNLHYSVKLIPEEKRQNKFVKFSFWTPLGVGGFYFQ